MKTEMIGTCTRRVWSPLIGLALSTYLVLPGCGASEDTTSTNAAPTTPVSSGREAAPVVVATVDDEPPPPATPAPTPTPTLDEIDHACGADATPPAIATLQRESRRIGALSRNRAAGARIVRRDAAAASSAHPLDAAIASIPADQGTAVERACFALRAVQATAELYLYDAEAMQTLEPSAPALARAPRGASIAAASEWTQRSLLPWMLEQQRRSLRAQEAYRRVAETKRLFGDVFLEARSAQGRAARHVADSIALVVRVFASVPMPAPIASDPELSATYRDTLNRNVEPVRNQALEAYDSCVAQLSADGPDAGVRASCSESAATLRASIPATE